MDLKNEIQRNETLKNNVTTIKNQLDTSIVRGGGVHSKTLADTVKNMQGMMKNYKKIAMGTATLTKTSNNLYNLDMNINFNPKRVIVIFLKGYTNKEEYTKYMAGLDTKQGQFGTNVSKRTFFLYDSNGNGVQLQIHSLNGKRLTLFQNGNNEFKKVTLDWIAIE